MNRHVQMNRIRWDEIHRQTRKTYEDRWAAERSDELLEGIERRQPTHVEVSRNSAREVFSRILCPIDFGEEAQ